MTLFIENAITWASKKKTDIVVGCHFNFVKNGGGLLIGGQSWHWAQSNPILEYAGNR